MRYLAGVPGALAHRMEEAHARGEEFRIGVEPGVDRARGRRSRWRTATSKRLPYQLDLTLRAQINSGAVDYVDAAT